MICEMIELDLDKEKHELTCFDFQHFFNIEFVYPETTLSRHNE